ncbi:MAG TPA: hypothetical protein VID70_05630 [Solirubrobacteraceae bacterium]|jgi:hypothetical protein
MLPSRIYSRSRTSLLAALFSLTVAAVLASVFASAALAAGPASVTVEVEGQSETKVPVTRVLTTTAPVVKDGEHACSGTSALGALELATAGNWSGPWNSGFNQYEIYSIMGETHQFEPGASANYYWSFWLNDQEASTGACEAELAPGDRVLLFPACYSETNSCPPSPTPLGIAAPASANADEAVSVTVSQYNAKGEASPAVGANIAGGGVSASTDSQGHATMRFSGDGTYTLHASGSNEGPPAVRSETSICVHEGNDGACGTSVSGITSPVQAPSTSTASHPYTGVFALVARSSSVSEGHVYPRGHAPRLLSGTVIAHSAVTSISISLRRSSRGRCFTYNGTRERFLKARCGRDSFFKVANGGTSFSYLLPTKLAPGRYVFDITSTDAAGNRAALARGSTRTVFDVR